MTSTPYIGCDNNFCRGKFGAWNWERKDQGLVWVNKDPGPVGSYQRQAEDRQLLSLVRGKFAQQADRLRQLFRRIDLDKDSLIKKEGFVKVVSGLCSSLSRDVLERVFDLVDRDGKGSIDYNQFVNKFGPKDILSEVKVRNLLGVSRFSHMDAWMDIIHIQI